MACSYNLTIPNAVVNEWNQPFGIGSFWDRTNNTKPPFRPGLMSNFSDTQPIFLNSSNPMKSGCLSFSVTDCTAFTKQCM